MKHSISKLWTNWTTFGQTSLVQIRTVLIYRYGNVLFGPKQSNLHILFLTFDCNISHPWDNSNKRVPLYFLPDIGKDFWFPTTAGNFIIIISTLIILFHYQHLQHVVATTLMQVGSWLHPHTQIHTHVWQTASTWSLSPLEHMSTSHSSAWMSAAMLLVQITLRWGMAIQRTLH